MAPKGTGIKEDPAPERQPAAAGVRRGGPLRVSAVLLMLFGATVIIGAAAAGPVPVPSPRLFGAFVVWLVGYLSLFIPPL
ncbi:hypothetical protein ACP70R_027358 [Stipagrostis hirtigluma subsp. patula]